MFKMTTCHSTAGCVHTRICCLCAAPTALCRTGRRCRNAYATNAVGILTDCSKNCITATDLCNKETSTHVYRKWVITTTKTDAIYNKHVSLRLLHTVSTANRSHDANHHSTCCNHLHEWSQPSTLRQANALGNAHCTLTCVNRVVTLLTWTLGTVYAQQGTCWPHHVIHIYARTHTWRSNTHIQASSATKVAANPSQRSSNPGRPCLAAVLTNCLQCK